jgi:ubiquinone/menaquinone biosynthesis C-methylase UbiE
MIWKKLEMDIEIKQNNETLAAVAFGRQSALFDTQYGGNTIIQYKRQRVRTHVLQLLPPGGSILELNSGTGEDAVYFAKKGFHVHATDLAEGMQQVLKQKVKENHLEARITQECCSYTALSSLKNKGPFDMIFSNFAGLNCTDELQAVLSQFSPLLNPGGVVTLVIMPGFCLWETLLIFKGKFKTAFRRFLSHGGRRAHIDGNYFLCWYYSPGFIRNCLKDSFDLLGTEGLCTAVPPSYIADFAETHLRSYRLLKKLEDRLKNKWPWRNIGDYYIISFKKTELGS